MGLFDKLREASNQVEQFVTEEVDVPRWETELADKTDSGNQEGQQR